MSALWLALIVLVLISPILPSPQRPRADAAKAPGPPTGLYRERLIKVARLEPREPES